MTQTKWLALIALAGLSACTVMPTGPSVMAMPGTGKTWDQFRTDDASCRNFALDQSGGNTASKSANAAAIGSAVVGTALGAAAGAAFGGGHGAAVGAGAGLLAGSVVGGSNAQASGATVQQRYDQAYTQCMYANGHQVPMSGRMMTSAPPSSAYTAPPPPPPPAY